MGLTDFFTSLLLQAWADWRTAAVPGLTMLICLLAGLGLAALVGAVNGLLIARVGLSPFVTTLGSLSICRGLGYVITEGRGVVVTGPDVDLRSEEHTSELQSLMRISSAVFCLKRKI